MHGEGRPRSARPDRAVLGLFGWLGLTAVAAGVGALGSRDAAAFYDALTRPWWAPPAAVFGPVWTVLYAVMATAAWVVWRRRGDGAARAALSLYVVQMVLNALWSWLFFRWRLGAWAVVEVAALWALLAATLLAFWRIRPLAGALLLPYLGWVTYAAALTAALWWANAGLL